ncbi:hypothetical protein P4910_21365 [Pantoea stewartii]|uniref:hypothetical protein n=1 Tax=Pantoea stewartii TaxID=66269 RepID=UPI0023F64948|nr:hypothetical protein [Pantoea stewartii]MDF7788003.1 hypothetical protein [Pantoea stewartii]
MVKMLCCCMLVFSLTALTGCETLAPERAECEKLMGKPIDEAFEWFGPPAHVDIETAVGPDSKFYGQTYYRFEHDGAQWDENKLDHINLDYVAGVAVQTEHYVTEHHQNICYVTLWTDTKTKIIDYYEVVGDCGLGWMGFGETGMFHYWGIN